MVQFVRQSGGREGNEHERVGEGAAQVKRILPRPLQAIRLLWSSFFVDHRISAEVILKVANRLYIPPARRLALCAQDFEVFRSDY